MMLHKRSIAAGVLLFASIPLFAHAGILSIFDNSMTYDRESALATRGGVSSQTLTILTPATHVDPNPAKGGAEIEVVDESALLASGSVSGESVDIEPLEQVQGQISVYEVRVGDSLSQIATMFGVSVGTIRNANDIKGAISPGQTLVILPISGIEYIVKKGDTLAKIAKKYKADESEVRIFNDLTGSLAVGDKLIIPHAELPAPKKIAQVSSKKSSGSSSSVSAGWLKWPVGGGVKTQGIHGYNAVDIGAPYGTPVYAAAAGTVIISRSGAWNGGYGNYVVIKHSNGVQTLYAHNSRNIVSNGKWVNQGDIIGYIGSTGRSTGNHLHFEVRGGRNPF